MGFRSPDVTFILASKKYGSNKNFSTGNTKHLKAQLPGLKTEKQEQCTLNRFPLAAVSILLKSSCCLLPALTFCFRSESFCRICLCLPCLTPRKYSTAERCFLLEMRKQFGIRTHLDHGAFPCHYHLWLSYQALNRISAYGFFFK